MNLFPFFRTSAISDFSEKQICFLTLFLIATSVFAQTYNFAVHGGGSKKEEFLDFAVDDAGNSYVLFQYDADVTFGDDTYTNASKNTLIAKFAENGDQLMTKDLVAGGTGAQFGAIGVSDSGLVVVGAGTKSGLLDGKKVYGGHFIGKLGPDGEFEWVKQPVEFDGGARQFNQFRVTAIAVTESEIYVAATANGTITFNGVTGPDYGVFNLQSALLIKMDLTGTVIWIQSIPTPDVDNHPTIDGGMDHILPSADGQHIYVAGKVGDGSINPYEVAYVAKFETDGTFSWVKRASSSGADSWGIAETSSGDLITGFGMGGAHLLDLGDGAQLEPSDTGYLGVLARLDKDGNVKTLQYVADALYSDVSSIGAQSFVRLYHVSVNQKSQVIIMGEMAGTHSFKNDIEVTSTPGLAGASKDVAIILTDLDFDPLAAFANTGGNNEWGRKSVSKGETIYFSGEYDSYRHPFYGVYQAQFGDFAFESAGNQDIYVASLTVAVSTPTPPPELALNITIEEDSHTLSWPSAYSDAALEFSSNLSLDSWETLESLPILEGDHWQITVPATIDPVFYRLRYQD